MTTETILDPRVTDLTPDKWCRRKIGKGRVCRKAGQKAFKGACSREHQGMPRCCGGVSRQGETTDGWPPDCTAIPVPGAPGGRCKWHGGASHPGGPDHPTWKGGRHSKFMPAGIRERAVEAWNDPELTRIREALAGLDAILTGHYLRLKDGKMPTEAQEKRILALTEQMRRLAGEETKRQAAMHQSVSLMQFLTVMRVVADIIRKYVTSDEARRSAQLELQRLLLTRDAAIDGEVIGGKDGDDEAGGLRNDSAVDPGGGGPTAESPGNH